MFTLFLGLMCMCVWDTARHKWFAALFCALTAYLGQICNVEGGAWLVIFTFMFRLITDSKRKFITSYSVLYVGNYLPSILKSALKHDRGGLLKNMLYLFCALWGALSYSSTTAGRAGAAATSSTYSIPRIWRCSAQSSC